MVGGVADPDRTGPLATHCPSRSSDFGGETTQPSESPAFRSRPGGLAVIAHRRSASRPPATRSPCTGALLRRGQGSAWTCRSASKPVSAPEPGWARGSECQWATGSAQRSARGLPSAWATGLATRLPAAPAYLCRRACRWGSCRRRRRRCVRRGVGRRGGGRRGGRWGRRRVIDDPIGVCPGEPVPIGERATDGQDEVTPVVADETCQSPLG